MNEKPCTVCGVPEAEHSTHWQVHSYVPPVDDAERESLSADGLRSVLSGGGTVSEVAERESEGGAASFGSSGASFLDRFNGLVIRAELAVQAFGDLVSKAVKHQTTTTAPVVEAPPVTSAPVWPVDNSVVVPVAPAADEIPPTVEHNILPKSEEPPSNPEPL